MIQNITINTQSSIRIQAGQVIYFDPYCLEEERHDADVIFITHDHFDHFDPDSIRKILRDDTMLVIPRSCFDAWSASGIITTQVLQMDPGQEMDIGGLLIKTIPAYNRLKPFHPKSKGWLGYVVTIDGRRVYVAGDTDATEESAAVECDIAFIPVGGKYTMNVAKAAELVNGMQPDIAVPTHYGTHAGKQSDGVAFRRAVDPGIHVPLLLHFPKSEDGGPEQDEAPDRRETEKTEE